MPGRSTWAYHSAPCALDFPSLIKLFSIFYFNPSVEAQPKVLSLWCLESPLYRWSRAIGIGGFSLVRLCWDPVRFPGRQQASKSTGEILRVTAKDIKALIDVIFRGWDRMDGIRYYQILTLTCVPHKNNAAAKFQVHIPAPQLQFRLLTDFALCWCKCDTLQAFARFVFILHGFGRFAPRNSSGSQRLSKPYPGVAADASCGTTVGVLGPRYAQKTFPYFNGHGTAETVAHGAQIMMASLGGSCQFFGRDASSVSSAAITAWIWILWMFWGHQPRGRFSICHCPAAMQGLSFTRRRPFWIWHRSFNMVFYHVLSWYIYIYDDYYVVYW